MYVLGSTYDQDVSPFPNDVQVSMDTIVGNYMKARKQGPPPIQARICKSKLKQPIFKQPTKDYGCPKGYFFTSGNGTTYPTPLCVSQESLVSGCAPPLPSGMETYAYDMRRYGGGAPGITRQALTRLPAPLASGPRAARVSALARRAAPVASAARAVASGISGYVMESGISGAQIEMLGAAGGSVTITGLLKLGSRGAQVLAVQKALNALNIFVDENSTYDALTEDGVKQFQYMHNLTADGVVGPATASALGFTYSAGGGKTAPASRPATTSYTLPSAPGAAVPPGFFETPAPAGGGAPIAVKASPTTKALALAGEYKWWLLGAAALTAGVLLYRRNSGGGGGNYLPASSLRQLPAAAVAGWY